MLWTKVLVFALCMTACKSQLSIENIKSLIKSGVLGSDSLSHLQAVLESPSLSFEERIKPKESTSTKTAPHSQRVDQSKSSASKNSAVNLESIVSLLKSSSSSSKSSQLLINSPSKVRNAHLTTSAAPPTSREVDRIQMSPKIRTQMLLNPAELLKAAKEVSRERARSSFLGDGGLGDGSSVGGNEPNKKKDHSSKNPIYIPIVDHHRQNDRIVSTLPPELTSPNLEPMAVFGDSKSRRNEYFYNPKSNTETLEQLENKEKLQKAKSPPVIQKNTLQPKTSKIRSNLADILKSSLLRPLLNRKAEPVLDISSSDSIKNLPQSSNSLLLQSLLNRKLKEPKQSKTPIFYKVPYQEIEATSITPISLDYIEMMQAARSRLESSTVPPRNKVTKFPVDVDESDSSRESMDDDVVEPEPEPTEGDEPAEPMDAKPPTEPSSVPYISTIQQQHHHSHGSAEHTGRHYEIVDMDYYDEDDDFHHAQDSTLDRDQDNTHPDDDDKHNDTEDFYNDDDNVDVHTVPNAVPVDTGRNIVHRRFHDSTVETTTLSNLHSQAEARGKPYGSHEYVDVGAFQSGRIHDDNKDTVVGTFHLRDIETTPLPSRTHYLNQVRLKTQNPDTFRTTTENSRMTTDTDNTERNPDSANTAQTPDFTEEDLGTDTEDTETLSEGRIIVNDIIVDLVPLENEREFRNLRVKIMDVKLEAEEEETNKIDVDIYDPKDNEIRSNDDDDDDEEVVVLEETGMGLNAIEQSPKSMVNLKHLVSHAMQHFNLGPLQHPKGGTTDGHIRIIDRKTALEATQGMKQLAYAPPKLRIFMNGMFQDVSIDEWNNEISTNFKGDDQLFLIHMHRGGKHFEESGFEGLDPKRVFVIQKTNDKRTNYHNLADNDNGKPEDGDRGKHYHAHTEVRGEGLPGQNMIFVVNKVHKHHHHYQTKTTTTPLPDIEITPANTRRAPITETTTEDPSPRATTIPLETLPTQPAGDTPRSAAAPRAGAPAGRAGGRGGGGFGGGGGGFDYDEYEDEIIIIPQRRTSYIPPKPIWPKRLPPMARNKPMARAKPQFKLRQRPFNNPQNRGGPVKALNPNFPQSQFPSNLLNNPNSLSNTISAYPNSYSNNAPLFRAPANTLTMLMSNMLYPLETMASYPSNLGTSGGLSYGSSPGVGPSNGLFTPGRMGGANSGGHFPGPGSLNSFGSGPLNPSLGNPLLQSPLNSVIPSFNQFPPNPNLNAPYNAPLHMNTNINPPFNGAPINNLNANGAPFNNLNGNGAPFNNLNAPSINNFNQPPLNNLNYQNNAGPIKSDMFPQIHHFGGAGSAKNRGIQRSGLGENGPSQLGPNQGGPNRGGANRGGPKRRRPNRGGTNKVGLNGGGPNRRRGVGRAKPNGPLARNKARRKNPNGPLRKRTRWPQGPAQRLKNQNRNNVNIPRRPQRQQQGPPSVYIYE